MLVVELLVELFIDCDELLVVVVVVVVEIDVVIMCGDGVVVEVVSD